MELIKDDRIKDQVIDFVEQYNLPVLFFKRKPITIKTDLRNDMRMMWEDAEELMEDYFKQFNVDPANYSLINYFPNEGSFLIPNFLLPKDARPTNKPPMPLTVNMLIESAKSGRWLYD